MSVVGLLVVVVMGLRLPVLLAAAAVAARIVHVLRLRLRLLLVVMAVVNVVAAIIVAVVPACKGGVGIATVERGVACCWVKCSAMPWPVGSRRRSSSSC